MAHLITAVVVKSDQKFPCAVAYSAGVEDSVKRLELTAQIAALRKRQDEAIVHATFVGWTPEAKAEHDKLSNLIGICFTQLARCSGE
jgi:hypothetical protein